MPNKAILDDIKKIKVLDSQNMRGSLESLGKQIEQIWNQGKKIRIPADYKKVNKILILGMGGSGSLPGLILKSLFFNELKAPIEVVGDYHVPSYTDKNTLVIASSYSGTTEEPLNAVEEAKNIGAKILALTSGGKLADWAKKNHAPAIVFSTENNPSGQPRMGVGYMVFGLITLLAEAGQLAISDSIIDKIVVKAKKKNNLAKNWAERIIGHSVWFVGAEHLSGNAHAAANQMNENGKRFASYFIIPELNHHLMEGMVHPKNNKNNLLFVFFESSLYDKRVQRRFLITKQILTKNKIKFVSYCCVSRTRFEQVAEVLVLSGYLSYYSALLEGIDPSPISYVDYFKVQLKKVDRK